MGNWKLLMTFTYPQDAHMAKGFLESEGVNVIITDELTAQVINFYSNAIGGVKLFVNENDYENGVKILQKGGYMTAADVEHEIKIEQLKRDTISDKSKCPFCNSKNIGKNSELNLFAVFFYFILGALFPIFRSSYKCFDCGKSWKFIK